MKTNPRLLVFCACRSCALFTLSLVAQESAAPAPLGSTVFLFEKLEAKPTEVGERRDVARQPTATLAEFECHISTLNPDRGPRIRRTRIRRRS